MQEQTLILFSHSQNSASIPIYCLALIYKNNEALHSVLQVRGRHWLDNEISSAMPVYNWVACVFLKSLILAAQPSFSYFKVLVLKEPTFQHQSKYPQDAIFKPVWHAQPCCTWLHWQNYHQLRWAQVKECWTSTPQFCPRYLRFPFLSKTGMFA